MEKLHVIVAGTRGYTNQEAISKKLDLLLSKKKAEGVKVIIVSGMCENSPDLCAVEYAKSRGLSWIEVPAQWKRADGTINRAAGFERNRVMAEVCGDALVAFWDGESKGTKHMIQIAKQCGLAVRVVSVNPAKIVQGKLPQRKQN